MIGKLILAVMITLNIRLLFGMNYTTPNEFCSVRETECKGHMDSNNNYKVICQDLCNQKYSINCMPKVCSASKEACEYLKKEKDMLYPFFKTITDEIRKLRYNYFLKIIQPCSKRKNWKSNEICLNDKKCYKSKSTVMSFGSVYYTTKVEECPCSNNHTYYCEENICASNRNACNGFRLKYKENHDAKKISLKKCK